MDRCPKLVKNKIVSLMQYKTKVNRTVFFFTIARIILTHLSKIILFSIKWNSHSTPATYWFCSLNVYVLDTFWLNWFIFLPNIKLMNKSWAWSASRGDVEHLNLNLAFKSKAFVYNITSYIY